MTQLNEPLETVLTLAEAAKIYYVDPKTIYWWWLKGHIKMRKSSDNWLVDFKSLMRYRGFPQEMPDFSEYL